jgi:DHA1 family multidrug resistance protein-like MFS transporter
MENQNWHKNLIAVTIAQFLVHVGFSFVVPFIPLFIQELGSYSNEQAAFWSGIATGAFGISMFLSGPIWGLTADRWGRKPMLLRAQFGSALLLVLSAFSPNIYIFTGLRAAQGLLSGTVAAASALLAAQTPRQRLPFALGTLMVAIYLGRTCGPVLGGIIADLAGFKATFLITGALLSVGGLIITFFVKENFTRPPRGKQTSLSETWQLARSREIMPLLLIGAGMYLAPQMVSPIIPLSIGELSPQGSEATFAGLAVALMGVLIALSSLATGRLGGRFSLKKIFVTASIGSGLLYLPTLTANSAAQMIVFVGLTGLFFGGVLTCTNAMVGLAAPANKQGLVYGIVQSAQALGGGLGPIIGGSLATVIGLRPVFAVSALVFIALGIAGTRLLVKRRESEAVSSFKA